MSDPQGKPNSIGPLKTILTIGFLIVTVGVTWRLRTLVDNRAPDMPDFDLSGLLVPEETVVPSGMPKEGLSAYDYPALYRASDIDSLATLRRKKYLVSSNRVIGVSIGGVARAYPMRVMYYHEVINDTLGGVPIAVSYSPLCDAVVVFDRRVDGEILEFGASGMLCSSNLLLYDRRPDHSEESLWSQLRRRAVSGPAAAQGKTLTQLPAALSGWGEWREHFPNTTVIRRLENYLELYRDNPFIAYFASEELDFPSGPLPSADDLPLKARVIAVGPASDFRTYSVAEIGRRADPSGEYRATVAGREFTMHYLINPEGVIAFDESGALAPLTYSYWFGWYAANQGVEIDGI